MKRAIQPALKTPSQMVAATGAKGQHPVITGKPGKFRRGRPQGGTTGGVAKTAEVEQHTVGVEKGVFMTTAQDETLGIVGDGMPTHHAVQPPPGFLHLPIGPVPVFRRPLSTAGAAEQMINGR